MGRVDDPPLLRVTVAHSPSAGVVDEVALLLAPGASVSQALVASRLAQRHPELDVGAAELGIWGVPCTAEDRLRDRDRVEVYRPLAVDPKEARRRRQRAQARR